MVEITTPRVEDWPVQRYAAVQTSVAMADLAGQLSAGWPRVSAWLEQRAATPCAAPFIRYLTIDMPDALLIDIGIPALALPATGDDGITIDEVPAGRYAVAEYFGAYDNLVEAHAALQTWAVREQLNFDADMGKVENWGSRLEQYLTDPASQPDPALWHTRLAYRLAT
ncbi:MAG: GyrI-like domain-containing protein [Pseudomonadota bacterium]